MLIARQVSSVAAANADATATLISAAREANSLSLAEIFGEGLALAANRLRTSGNIVLSASIQTQATSRDVPIALSEAFLDNMEGTAATAGSAARAGDITADNSGDLVGGGTGSGDGAGSGGTAQLAGVSAPTHRSGSTTSNFSNGRTGETLSAAR